MRDAIILGDAERPQAPQTDSGSLGGWGRGCPHVTGAFLHGVSHDAEGTRCSSDSRCGITFKDGATWRPVRARGCHSGVVVSGAGAEGEEPRVSSHLRLLIRCSPLGSLASFLTVASWSVTREPLGAAGSPRFAEHFPHGGSLPGGLSGNPPPVSATHPWRPWRSPRSGTKALGEAEPRERTQVTDGSSLTLSCSLPPQRCSGGSCLPSLLPSGQLASFLGFCWVAQTPALPLFLPKAAAAAPPCPAPRVFLPPVGLAVSLIVEGRGAQAPSGVHPCPLGPGPEQGPHRIFACWWAEAERAEVGFSQVTPISGDLRHSGADLGLGVDSARR